MTGLLSRVSVSVPLLLIDLLSEGKKLLHCLNFLALFANCRRRTWAFSPLDTSRRCIIISEGKGRTSLPFPPTHPLAIYLQVLLPLPPVISLSVCLILAGRPAISASPLMPCTCSPPPHLLGPQNASLLPGPSLYSLRETLIAVNYTLTGRISTPLSLCSASPLPLPLPPSHTIHSYVY
jgi:hypothetical protein